MQNNKFRKGLVIGIIVSIIGSGIFAIVPVMKADLSDGLIGYWNFDNGTADDESGNNHHGTVYGASIADGISGNAFSFDGDDDYIDFGDDSDFDITGDITIALWFKTDTSQLGALVSKLDPINPDNGYNLVMGDIIYNYPPVPDGTIYFMIAKDSTGLAQYDVAQTTSTFTDDTWHFLTAIYTPDGASRPKIFIDSVEQSVNYYGNALSSIGASPGYPLKIAEYSFGSGYYNFKGSVDEVRLYNRALTGDEIQYLYDNPGGTDIVYVDDDYDSSTPGWQIDHFDNIQDGIDAVDEGGTVYVYNGIYYENVVIDKTINLIGEDKNNAIIDASTDYGNGVQIFNCDNVNISNFTIRNALIDYGHPRPSFTGNGVSILAYVYTSGSETANHNWISNCIIYNNSRDGIQIQANEKGQSADYNIISNCEIYDNGADSLSDKGHGVCMLPDRDGVTGWSWTRSNEIKNCTIYNNNIGIRIGQEGEASNNIISECQIFDNSKYGLYLWGHDGGGAVAITSNNYIFENNIYGNYLYGMYIETRDGANCGDNYIYHNNFLDSDNNAYDEHNNYWDDGYPSGGNYWDDYAGIDSDGDGIGDTPYPVSGGSNQDNYPFINQDGWLVVWDPVEAIDDLIYDVEEMELHRGLENSLTHKLINAIKSLGHDEINAAINQLNAFINQVEAQRGKKLTEEQADYLVAEAQAIIDLL